MHVLLTGASAGIGRELARAFASRPGARLTLVARRRAALEALASELGVPTVVVVADLSDPASVEDVLAAAREAHGPIDVLVNNAGAQVLGELHRTDLGAAERSLALNLTTPLRLMHGVLAEQRRRGAGAIVNIASMAAMTPTPGMTWYNAGKAGIAAASEALAGELRGTGVHVLTVYPGIVRTEMAERALATFDTHAALALQPTVSAEALARDVLRALDRRRARLVRPRVYWLTRWMAPLAQWMVVRLAPGFREVTA